MTIPKATVASQLVLSSQFKKTLEQKILPNISFTYIRKQACIFLQTNVKNDAFLAQVFLCFVDKDQSFRQ
jgi:hypothetical protein